MEGKKEKGETKNPIGAFSHTWKKYRHPKANK